MWMYMVFFQGFYVGKGEVLSSQTFEASWLAEMLGVSWRHGNGRTFRKKLWRTGLIKSSWPCSAVGDAPRGRGTEYVLLF